MTPDEYAFSVLARRDEIRDLFDKWVHALGLKWWHIDIIWEVEEKDATLRGFIPCFSVEAKWKYLDAVIYVYLPAVAKVPDDRLEYLVVHELIHILVNELCFWNKEVGGNSDQFRQHDFGRRQNPNRLARIMRERIEKTVAGTTW